LPGPGRCARSAASALLPIYLLVEQLAMLDNI
jgi:hypothetical protein